MSKFDINDEKDKMAFTEALYILIRVIEPMVPHLAEECWSLTGKTQSITNEPWPKVNEKYLENKEVTVVIQINGKRRGEVIVLKDSSENEVKKEMQNIKNIKAKFLSGGQKKKLVISLSLLSDPKVLLLDECFAALDVLTIKMLQEIIVNLQQENQITICICDHQARDLLACVDIAMILSNCKIIAQDTPSNLVKDINARNAYFGNSFKFS